MGAITRYVLKRPVTTFMALLCLVVFGISSVFSATLEQMPDTDQPMLIIIGMYTGAGPEDIDELVTEPIEDEVSTLEGVKNMSSISSEGRAMIMLEYDYGTDMDDAYDELKRSLDSLAVMSLPDDCETAVMEMNMDAGTTMSLAINHETQENLYDYVDQTIVPMLEQLTTVAEVESAGGASEYVKVELKSDKMRQYHVTADLIASAVMSADLSYPSGSAEYGSLDLSVTTSSENDSIEDMMKVPITTSRGKTIYLEDIATVGMASESADGISRYNGEDTISLNITKQQSSSAMENASQVKEVIEKLMAEDSDLNIIIASNSADDIISSLKDVASTMVLAVVISMIIIFIFFGDLKASLIVGSSIPTSILVTLIVLTGSGYSLNVITMSALTMGVGMMVDNSIVVLESCFRSITQYKSRGVAEYAKAALEGTNIVSQSILGGTITTCVVFIPLMFLEGMSGQMFKPLGFTIVYCMTASLLSAITIVPLIYMLYKPKEAEKALMSKPMEHMENAYRKVLPHLLKHKALVLASSFGLVVVTLMLASGMETELMTSDDTGTITVTVDIRPGLQDEKADEILSEAESIVSTCIDVESYMLRYMDNSGTITAYLLDNRSMDTDDIVALWEEEMADISNCTIDVSTSGSMNFMSSTDGYEVILHGTDYDELKEVSDEIVKEMTNRDDVINIHSSLENTAPVVSINVDQTAAAAEGLTAVRIGNQVKQLLDGVDLTELVINGQEIDVKAEYPEDEYRTVAELEDIILTKTDGSYVALLDVAEITFDDNPSSISKYNKAYEITITADYTGEETEKTIDSEVIEPRLSATISIGTSTMDRMMNEEFSALFKAIATAVFLIFVVMAAQFESPKFSFMVMTTIPFSLVGSFALLKLADCTISMTSILGFLILVGTVVNNGILYVDAVNQSRAEMDLKTALVESGATRLRPILMTSLTTILSMLPMAFAYGDSGATTQGLALVNIGGLTAGVLVALFVLPVYYAVMSGKKERRVIDI